MTQRLDRVDARAKLPVRPDPFWQPLGVGRGVGYRTQSGTWIARALKVDRDRKKNPYDYKPLAGIEQLAAKDQYFKAKAAAEEWFTHLDQGGAVQPGTVSEACKARVDYLRREKSESAADGAEGYYKRLVYGDPIARVDLSKAKKHQFEAFRKRVQDACGLDELADDDPRRKSRKASFNRSITPIRAALNHAKKVGKVATDQAWSGALKPMEGEGNRRDNYLEPEERASLIEHASDELKRYLTVLRLLPLRPGDVACLKVKHFNARAGTLSVPDGKTERRVIPLSADAVAHFKECSRSKHPDSWLISRDDSSQWKRWDWRDEIKLAAAGARLPRITCAYDVRHSTISDLVTNTDLDLLTIAQISGTSVAMIEKNYGKLRQHRARAGLELLAKM